MTSDQTGNNIASLLEKANGSFAKRSGEYYRTHIYVFFWINKNEIHITKCNSVFIEHFKRLEILLLVTILITRVNYEKLRHFNFDR